MATTQSTAVTDYRRRFIETASPLERVSKHHLLGHFINGKKEDIRAEVRLLNPITLEQAMELALRVEEKYQVAGVNKHVVSSLKTGLFSSYTKGLGRWGSHESFYRK